MTSPGPGVLIGPQETDWLRDAVVAGGGQPVDDPRQAQAVVWRGSDHTRLADILTDAPGIRWVQLGAAGTDAWASTGLFADGRVWTSAKGAYSEAVAEHVLALTLALLREIPHFSASTTWRPQAGRSLFGLTALVLGAAGGIGQEIIRLLEPFRVHVLEGHRDTVRDRVSDEFLTLDDALPRADVVLLATPLTPGTRGLIGRAQLQRMRTTSVLVNVARGAVIDTPALVDALTNRQIAAAGLDVTDPEPLPEGHPLWSLKNCLITPHTANTPDMLTPQLGRRVTQNVALFASGQPLLGVVDAAKGY